MVQGGGSAGNWMSTRREREDRGVLEVKCQLVDNEKTKGGFGRVGQLVDNEKSSGDSGRVGQLVKNEKWRDERESGVRKTERAKEVRESPRG